MFLRDQLPFKIYIFVVISVQNFIPDVNRPLKKMGLIVIFTVVKTTVKNTQFFRE